LATITVNSRKGQFSKHKYDVFVEVIADSPAHPAVAPSSMNEKQSTQVEELADSVIRASYGLSAFFTPDTHSDVSLHYHWYIVCPITDADSDPRAILFCKYHNVTLLLWTYPAANDADSEQA